MCIRDRGWYSGMSPSKPCDICILISTFEKVGSWIPFTEGGFVSCLVEIGTVVLEKTTGYFQISCIFALLITAHWNVRSPSFKQTSILFTWECFVPSLVDISLIVKVLEKKIFKCRQCILAISLQLKWAKTSAKIWYCIYISLRFSSVRVSSGDAESRVLNTFKRIYSFVIIWNISFQIR